ncbi:hypothetical protein ACFFGH_18120 [Lysobacter korlensis]|uniref:Ubiquinone biosynthesis protein UbiH n=1 Tax=Lysobacter korlensis TaxID=553636 RepID=A0ABV6RS01_9GAMM
MNDFFQTALAFPTLLYSVALAVCTIYWVLTATGLVELEGLDGLMAVDGDASAVHSGAGMMAKFGLGGVPLVLVLTVVSFFGWLTTYYVQLLVLQHLPELIRVVAGLLVAVLALVPAVIASAIALKPVRILLDRLRPEPLPPVLGRTGVVSTANVSNDFGMVTVDDGGAGLVLQVRDDGTEQFRRGDRVVLVEYLEGQNAYRVMAESKFLSP